ELLSINYSLQSGTINQVDPGVWFYWTQVTAKPKADGTFSVIVDVDITTTTTFNKFWTVQSVSLFNADCTGSTLTNSFTTNAATGETTLNVSGATTEATYIVAVKYSKNGLTGITPPDKTVIHYDVSTYLTDANATLKFVQKDANGVDFTL